MDGATLACDAGMSELLHSQASVLAQRLKQCRTVAAFVRELEDLLDRALEAKPPASLPPAAFYSRVLAEVDVVGWHRVADVHEDLSQLSIECQDAGSRTHVLGVALSPAHPAIAPTCTADLPEPFQPAWSADHTLSHVVSAFERALDANQALWDVLDDLDANTWVLEPEHPARSDCVRRIAIGRHCSISVQVSPETPRSQCECRFFGAETIVGPMRDRFHALAAVQWDAHKLPRHNLESLLGIQFPHRAAADAAEDMDVECGICYTYRLQQDDALLLPDRTCDHPQCGRPFHNACLYEWLRALPTSRQSFDVLYGSCPYCAEPISAKLR